MKYALMLLLLTGCNAYEFHSLHGSKILSSDEWEVYKEEYKCHLGIASKYFWECEEPTPEIFIDSRINL